MSRRWLAVVGIVVMTPLAVVSYVAGDFRVFVVCGSLAFVLTFVGTAP